MTVPVCCVHCRTSTYFYHRHEIWLNYFRNDTSRTCIYNSTKSLSNVSFYHSVKVLARARAKFSTVKAEVVSSNPGVFVRHMCELDKVI